MKSIYKKTYLALAGVLLSAGFAMAQTTTVNFSSPTCTTAATCGLAGGTNQMIESSGDSFFFQEAVIINGKQLNHMIVRSKPDASTGSVFSQETFTPGGVVQGATNTISTDQLTFKQILNATGGTVNVTTRMDNLNIINKGTAAGQENMVGTEINITQSITDTVNGLTRNTVTITPNTTTAAAGDFNTHVDQAVSDPATPGFSSSILFDTGTPAVVTVNQNF
ncbi:MAG: hypothetical protein HY282_05335 [Nitrospirae bacterium]|nr:hypothetical protein [Candidatus Manganitrophaceae bacterium]